MNTAFTTVGRLVRERANPRSLLRSGTVMSAVTLVVLMLVWSYYLPGGLTNLQFNNYVVLATTLALASFGTTLVVVSGGFDLSVAGVISLANVLAATQMGESTGHAFLIAALIVLVGLGAGLINGIAVAIFRLESIAATLATYIMLQGLALVLLAAPGGLVPAGFAEPITNTIAGGFPVALLLLIALAGIWLVLQRTRYGVGVFAVGADEESARMSGVPVERVKIVTYGIAGVSYALAGLYYSAVTSTGDPNAGTPFLLTAFAAVALGGTVFGGGQGSAIASILGAGVLAVIPKVLFVLGAADFWSGLVQGIVIIGAVLMGLAGMRFGASRRGQRTAEA